MLAHYWMYKKNGGLIELKIAHNSIRSIIGNGLSDEKKLS